MHYELRRLDQIGCEIGNHPIHYVRHLALADSVLRTGASSVLSLDCGKGLVEYILPSGMPVVGLDLSADDIEFAKHINRFKQKRRFIVGSVYDAPALLLGEKINCVLISEVLEHLPDDGSSGLP
jgi:2-polyprenyl-3-methyl-5-hydroxy-6-metoxy-1,4-benzoquinol methylase